MGGTDRVSFRLPRGYSEPNFPVWSVVPRQWWWEGEEGVILSTEVGPQPQLRHHAFMGMVSVDSSGKGSQPDMLLSY